MKTILLAEDNESFQKTIRQVLEIAGYNVLTADDGMEALKLIESHPQSIDLLLADLMMPNLDGAGLADRMRRIFPGLRVLFITGFGSETARRPMMDDRSALLKKPISAEELLSKVLQLLELP